MLPLRLYQVDTINTLYSGTGQHHQRYCTVKRQSTPGPNPSSTGLAGALALRHVWQMDAAAAAAAVAAAAARIGEECLRPTPSGQLWG